MPAPCRFCAAPLETVVADLGMSPIANDYLTAEQANGMEPFYPLRALVCSTCFLVQLEDYSRAEALFADDYAYFSSYSTSWLSHSERYVEAMTERFGLGASSKVVELASNDGYLLQYFVARGVPVLGIEPAASVAQAAQLKGVPTVQRFFGVETANDLAGQAGADLLIGNNVLAHVPDLNDFVGGMRILLKPDGVVTMEFPHLMRQMQDNQWDTIYHEHFSYLSFLTVTRIFAAHGLRLFDVDELPTHGGSLRIFGCHDADASKADTGRVTELLENEEAAGLADLDTYRHYGQRVAAEKRDILEFLIALKRDGKRIVGYGAPAKGNTLLNYCGLGTDFVEYTCDLNPHKQDHFLPGTHIPIASPDRLREDKPDVIFILPWNLKDEIVEQLAYVREWGGRFVARTPDIQLLP
ncbi:MAG: class I SAM-dependent methyltransferase [Actinomycetota bacterium]|nr:class I SAM-dependent methyltransferase [Actinomycetota bacterium]